MTGIGSLGLSQTVTASSTRCGNKTKSLDLFGWIPGYKEAKERAQEKIAATGGRWTGNPLFKDDFNSALGYTVNKDAINSVCEKLESEGIDPSKRTPTHEITDEQMAQLAEKYDLEYLSMAGMNDTEYGNFLLDLAYMNVFSCDELASEFCGIRVPMNYLYEHETGKYIWNDQYFGTYDDMVKAYQMDYIRTQDPGRSESYYQGKYEDIMAKTQERMNILNDFFDRASKYSYPDLTNAPKPKVEDASGKLKEDFGIVS